MKVPGLLPPAGWVSGQPPGAALGPGGPVTQEWGCSVPGRWCGFRAPLPGSAVGVSSGREQGPGTAVCKVPALGGRAGRPLSAVLASEAQREASRVSGSPLAPSSRVRCCPELAGEAPSSFGCLASAADPSVGRAGEQRGGRPSRLTPGRPPPPALNPPRPRPRLPPPHRPALAGPFLTRQEFPEPPRPQLGRFCTWILAKKTSVSCLLMMQTLLASGAPQSPCPRSAACGEIRGGWHLSRGRGSRPCTLAGRRQRRPQTPGQLLPPPSLWDYRKTPPPPPPEATHIPGDPRQPARGEVLGGVPARGHTPSWGAAVSWSVCWSRAGPGGATRPGDRLASQQAWPGPLSPRAGRPWRSRRRRRRSGPGRPLGALRRLRRARPAPGTAGHGCAPCTRLPPVRGP